MAADVVLRGERVIVRPTVDDDLGRLRAIRNSPEVVRWWGLENDWPFDDASVERWTILAEDRVIGLLTVSEERDPQYRSAGFDIYLDPVERGQGLGPEAIRVLARHLADARGHHRFTIDPRAETRRPFGPTARPASGPSVCCGATSTTVRRAGGPTGC